jgi:two-component system, chemotaxis family, CheB/CheR fusion protein
MASLAADQRERAIAVVLTGLDSGGTLGVKAIKAEGGPTIAQRPREAMAEFARRLRFVTDRTSGAAPIAPPVTLGNVH